ncbi:MAG: glycosyltransferase family 2 protein [Anaerolineales bacterium]|nr:glycosyltransferase family 2 protein [Anaerolineales bacterium]
MIPVRDNARVFVVVPAYNEGKVICNAVRPLLKAGYSVVVVDDCSQDNTWQKLGGLPLHRLRHPINLGQGAALQTGMAYALAHNAEVIVHFDADGQHDAADLPTLCEPIWQGRAAVVLGSRFLRARDLSAVPALRRLLLRLAIVVNWLFTGLQLSDAHNGFRALSAHAARQIQLHENGFAHATEILYQIRATNLRVMERPTHVRYTDYSKQKGQRAWHAVDILVDLVVRRLLR